MTPDQVFSIANAVALCAWILLVVLPRQRWVSGILAPIVMPAFFALIYVAIIATQWKGSAGGFSTLSAVGMLFSQPSTSSSAAGKYATRASTAFRISRWCRACC